MSRLLVDIPEEEWAKTDTPNPNKDAKTYHVDDQVRLEQEGFPARHGKVVAVLAVGDGSAVEIAWDDGGTNSTPPTWNRNLSKML